MRTGLRILEVVGEYADRRCQGVVCSGLCRAYRDCHRSRQGLRTRRRRGHRRRRRVGDRRAHHARRGSRDGRRPRGDGPPARAIASRSSRSAPFRPRVVPRPFSRSWSSVPTPTQPHAAATTSCRPRERDRSPAGGRRGRRDRKGADSPARRRAGHRQDTHARRAADGLSRDGSAGSRVIVSPTAGCRPGRSSKCCDAGSASSSAMQR